MAAPLGDRLGTDIITLVVGPKRKEFAVHKSILCDASDLFAKDLVKKEDVPGIKSHLHYPTDDPTVISLFVDYLYRSTVPERSASGDLFTLFNLYLFAERLCLRDLANKTADRIQDLLQQLPTDQPGAEEFAKDVYCKAQPGSPLRTLIAEMMVYNHWTLSKVPKGSPQDCIISRKSLKKIWTLCHDNEGLFQDIFSHLQRFSVSEQLISTLSKPAKKIVVNSPWDPANRRLDDPCYYHVHIGDGDRCETKVKESK